MLPEYICDVILNPLNDLDIEPVFYSVDDSFSPNWKQLSQLIKKNTRGIFMVQYFGQPQDLNKFKEFCNNYKLILIEDNAHGIGGILNGYKLGSLGDISISSAHKIINVYSGGILKINNDISPLEINLKPYPITIRQRINRYLLNNNPKLRNLIKKYFFKRPLYDINSESNDKDIGDYKIDKISLNIINKVNWDILRKKRQNAYYIWEDFVLKNNLTPVFNKLYEEANPWCFPAYTKSHKESVKWIKWGWEKKIKIFSWPSLPKQILGKKGDSYKRWKKLICFDIIS